MRAQAPPQPPEPKPAAPTPAPPQPQPPAQTKSGYEELESKWSIGVFYWRPDRAPILRGGASSTNPPAQALDFPGKPRETPGVTLWFPTGHSNRVEVSAFETRGSGSLTAPGDV